MTHHIVFISKLKELTVLGGKVIVTLQNVILEEQYIENFIF